MKRGRRLREQKFFHFQNVDSVNKASHWIAEIEEINAKKEITAFQHYKVHFNPYDMEYLIRNNDGDMTDDYLTHKGKFVVLIKD